MGKRTPHSTDRQRKGAVYERLTSAARNTPGPCILCGRDIDRTLPHTDAASPTAEHVAPLTTGGHPLGPMGPAHRVCNMRRYNKPMTPELLRYLATAPLEWDNSPKHHPTTPRHSQDW
jgi:hypothetical protein